MPSSRADSPTLWSGLPDDQEGQVILVRMKRGTSEPFVATA